MPSLEELIGKAKTAPTPYVDIDVSINAGISDRIAAIEREMGALTVETAAVEKDQRFSDPRRKQLADKRAALEEKLHAVQAEAADSLVTLRFTKLDPAVWAELTARSPMRPDTVMDLNYGYNYHEVCRKAAWQSTSRVEGTTVTPVPKETVEGILQVVSGNDLERIMSAVFDVNVWSSSQDLAAAKKASRAATATE